MTPVVELIRDLVRAPIGQFLRGVLLLALVALILCALAVLVG